MTEKNASCMQGCDTEPRDEAVMPSPGQLLHSLHGLDADEQRGLMQRLLESQEVAQSCFVYGHVDRLAEVDDLRIENTLLRREVEFEALGADTFSGADAAVEGGDPTP